MHLGVKAEIICVKTWMRICHVFMSEHENIYCLSASASAIYEFLKDWLPTILAAVAALFAWFTWEVNTLIAAIDRSGMKLEPRGKFDKEFFARRLSRMPTCIAEKILSHALSRTGGLVFWKDWHDMFMKEHRSIRKSRKELVRSGSIK